MSVRFEALKTLSNRAPPILYPKKYDSAFGKEPFEKPFIY